MGGSIAVRVSDRCPHAPEVDAARVTRPVMRCLLYTSDAADE